MVCLTSVARAAGLALILTAGTASAQERQVTVVNGFPPGSLVEKAHAAYIEEMGRTTSLRGTGHSMSLLSLMETSAGLRDGIADIGYVLTGYTANDFPNANLAGDMNMLSTSGSVTAAPGVVMTGVYLEYSLFNCPECLGDFKAQNQVLLGGGASTEHLMLCREPVNGLADLKNKKLRVNSNSFGRWAEAMGGVKISVPGAEMYEALAQGVADCLLVSMPELTNWKLNEVGKYVYKGAPGGVYANVASASMNRDLWKELSPEDRLGMLKLAAMVSAEVDVGYIDQAVAAEADSRAKGLTIAEAPADIIAATNEFVEQDVKVLTGQAEKDFGISNAAERVEVIRGLVEKWKGHVAKINPADRAEVTALMWDEVFSKVDAATYAMD